MKVTDFGATVKGDETKLYTLTNKNGMEIAVSDYGATLVQVIVPDKEGKPCDVVLGYDEAAKICLTHSFNNHTLDEYIGKLDVSEEEMEMIKTELARTVYDDYDRLIQLCDSLAGAEGVLDIEDRMNDVKKRYGFYPQDKWDSNMRLKQYFEKKMKKDIYLVCEKDSFVPEEIG